MWTTLLKLKLISESLLFISNHLLWQISLVSLFPDLLASYLVDWLSLVLYTPLKYPDNIIETIILLKQPVWFLPCLSCSWTFFGCYKI
jgi:hypothetical protein